MNTSVNPASFNIERIHETKRVSGRHCTLDDSDGEEGDGVGGGGGGMSVSRLLSSVKKVTAIASAMKTGRKKRGGGGGKSSAGGDGGGADGGGVVEAAEELGYELRQAVGSSIMHTHILTIVFARVEVFNPKKKKKKNVFLIHTR